LDIENQWSLIGWYNFEIIYEQTEQDWS
jgi:hypothetical protein